MKQLLTGVASICSNRKAAKTKSKVKVTGEGKICISRNSHANLAVASSAPTSAKIDVSEGLPVNFGSAETDSLLTCIKTNSTNKNKILGLTLKG